MFCSTEELKIYFKKSADIDISIKVSLNIESFCLLTYVYIEDIQMFLLNMAFISSSEVEHIYIS